MRSLVVLAIVAIHLADGARSPARAQLTPVCGDTAAVAERRFTGFGVFVDEDDLPLASSEDRNYTGGAGIAVSGGCLSRLPVIAPIDRWLFGWFTPKLTEDSTLTTRHSAVLIGSAFTPDSIIAKSPVIGDRPYGSIFGLSLRRTVVPIRFRDESRGNSGEYYPEAFKTELVIGFLGLNVAKTVQDAIHTANGSNLAQGWGYQISDGGEFTMLARAQYERLIFACTKASDPGLPQGCGMPGPAYDRKFVEATWWGEAQAGYYTNVSSGIRGRLGFFRSGFWDFEGDPGNSMAQATANNRSSPFEAFLHFSLGGRYVLYNALLQGQWGDSAYTLSTDMMRRGIGEFTIGAYASAGSGPWRVAVSYALHGRTSEIEGPYARTHTWATPALNFSLLPGG